MKFTFDSKKKKKKKNRKKKKEKTHYGFMSPFKQWTISGMCHI